MCGKGLGRIAGSKREMNSHGRSGGVKTEELGVPVIWGEKSLIASHKDSWFFVDYFCKLPLILGV